MTYMTYIPFADIHKGDQFYFHGLHVKVLRASAAGWVDVRVRAPGGTTWTKRMPNGIPTDWKRHA
jgi:hypothetical protein